MRRRRSAAEQTLIRCLRAPAGTKVVFTGGRAEAHALVELGLARRFRVETVPAEPLEAIRAAALAARTSGVVLHVDASEHLPVDMAELGVDALTVAQGPEGVAAVLFRPGVLPEPLWDGGGQEHGVRSGTPAVPLIVGLAKAVELLSA